METGRGIAPQVSGSVAREDEGQGRARGETGRAPTADREGMVGSHLLLVGLANLYPIYKQPLSLFLSHLPYHALGTPDSFSHPARASARPPYVPARYILAVQI